MALKIDQKNLSAEAYKKIKLLILHGSQAKGMATDKSDIDIGILSDGKIDTDRYFEIIRDFEGVFGDKFDPVFLNNAEPMISLHVAISGKPLFSLKPGNFEEFKVQSMARYMDTKKFRELEKQYVKRAAGKVQNG